MFSLLSSHSQIYGLQQQQQQQHQPATANQPITADNQKKSNSLPHKNHKQQQPPAAQHHRRSTSSLSDTGGKFFATLTAKSPSTFIEKFIKHELLQGYDTLKCQGKTSPSEKSQQQQHHHQQQQQGPLYSNLQTDWGGFNCLQGSYRSNCDGEFYEAVQVKPTTAGATPTTTTTSDNIMRSKHALATSSTPGAATLQNYQKLPEFNVQAAGHTPAYKKLTFGARLQKQNAEHNSDNSQSSHSTTTTTRSSLQKSSGSEVHRSSSGSSSGYDAGNHVLPNAAHGSPERLQRLKLLQMISNYDQQNKQLQRELAKEKRRRTEELTCVVKSLLCFESKLKSDMKVVNQRLLEKDAEICRLVRQNRALRKRLESVECNRDEGMVADQYTDEDSTAECLVLEALQCNNCRKQFYDIELKASSTQTGKEIAGLKEAARAVAEHGSSSDDTVSSSFYGARRSVRYTSKRTPGTFRDYMRSRAMNIDDPSLEQQSEENTSSISREDSQTSYEQLHNYARAMERMHGVKPLDDDGDYSEQSSLELCQQQQQQQQMLQHQEPHRSSSRTTNHSSSSRSSCKTAASAAQLEEDDGIFSPTQDDDDFDELDEEEQLLSRGAIKIVQRRCAEFSEASPKQIYETSTDDWYASASDQEELNAGNASAKPYGHGAINPVLECVNQILLQQSMEETANESPKPLVAPTALSHPKSALMPNSGGATSHLPRRSSLSGRSASGPPCVANGRKRVHFSTKNSMVHVPRHDEDDAEHEMISHYHPMAAAAPTTAPASETLNYESIYSNEYEPIGSERASNLYVDMESSSKTLSADEASAAAIKLGKLPPALPPKPANLLKFKKSLQQLEEVADEGGDCAASTTTATEPDYCSISEVGMTSVQIIADIHKVPPPSEPDLEMSTVASDDTFTAASQKTEEIEEIFADIPKLPNVAAIIAPKQTADYLMMTSKSLTRPNRLDASPLRLQLPSSTASGNQQQYKRKHVPNILAEINKRMSLPNSPTTPTTPKSLQTTPTKSKSLLQLTDALPLQAEFDWYNLDAEYGKTTRAESPKTIEGMLEEISEGNECIITAADEYNLDEEFNLNADHDEVHEHEPKEQHEDVPEHKQAVAAPPTTKAKKMKKNLASFEKFIEGSGLSTKPLPSKRKIYFSGPFV